MRKVILLTVLLALVVFALPTHAGKAKDVNIANTPLPITGEVNATVKTVYRFARFSTTITTGYVGGIAGMHSICQTDLGDSSARMCTTKEVILSPNAPDVGDGFGWVQPEIVAVVLRPGSPDFLVYVDYAGGNLETWAGDPLALQNCAQWGAFGPSGNTGTTIGTGILNQGCLGEIPVACCTPSN